MIIFQQVDVYLNEPIKIDKLTNIANQSIQRRTGDRSGKDNKNCYFESEKEVSHLNHKKKEAKNVMILSLNKKDI